MSQLILYKCKNNKYYLGRSRLPLGYLDPANEYPLPKYLVENNPIEVIGRNCITTDAHMERMHKYLVTKYGSDNIYTAFASSKLSDWYNHGILPKAKTKAKKLRVKRVPKVKVKKMDKREMCKLKGKLRESLSKRKANRQLLEYAESITPQLLAMSDVVRVRALRGMNHRELEAVYTHYFGLVSTSPEQALHRLIHELDEFS